MYPVIAELGPITIYSYGLVLALAFMVCGWLYSRELKRGGLDPLLADVVVFWSVIGGVLGARLYYLVLHWDDPAVSWVPDSLACTGIVWYGGLGGALLASLLAVKRRGAPLLRMLDLVAPVLALGYGIGRIGCFLAGDGDYGPPSDLPWAMAFPRGTIPTEVPVHPTPLYELAFSLIVFAILWSLRLRPRPAGWMFSLFLVLQGAERVLAEVWRINPPVVWGLSDAQVIGLLCIIAGLIWLAWLRGRSRPRSEQAGA